LRQQLNILTCNNLIWGYVLSFRASVESVMRSPPVTASVTESVLSIANRMVSNDIGAIIVVINESIAGIITERDLVDRVVRMQRNPANTRAQDIMTSPVKTIEVDSKVADALKLMRYDRVRRLVITRKGKLVGIVSERRLLESFAQVV
jgi:signal-transduction protein with cAMP-binding, CBS, and nucleotidyltransferase domain